MPRPIQVSPRHHVALADDYLRMIDVAPREDFVVRNLARRKAGQMTLMMGSASISFFFKTGRASALVARLGMPRRSASSCHYLE